MNIEHRITELENATARLRRSAGRWRIATASCFVLLFAAFCLAAAQQEPRNKPVGGGTLLKVDSVVANKMVVTDEEGKVVGLWTSPKAGECSLQFTRPGGEIVTLILGSRESDVAIALKSGNGAVEMSAGDDGAMIVCQSGQGKARLIARHGAGKEPDLGGVIVESDGQEVFRTRLKADEKP